MFKIEHSKAVRELKNSGQRVELVSLISHFFEYNFVRVSAELVIDYFRYLRLMK